MLFIFYEGWGIRRIEQKNSAFDSQGTHRFNFNGNIVCGKEDKS